MHVTFRCGKSGTVNASVQEAPVCGCAVSHPIIRVTAPPPSIRGTASGPFVTSVKLDPVTVNLCADGKSPLPVPVDPSKVEEKKTPRSLKRVH